MVKFTISRPDGNTCIGLGLSALNVENLLDGKPILVKGEQLNQSVDVFVFYGRDEDNLLMRMREFGAIDEQTIIRNEVKTKP